MAFLDETGLAYFWSKIKNKFLAKNNVANNLTTTDKGYALDARQGPVLLNKIRSGGVTLNEVYPVGSIYMSVNDVDPATLFGGKWTQLKDRFLVGAGNSYTVNATGGETKHTHKYGVTYNAYFGGVAGADEALIRTIDYPTNNTNNAVAVTNASVDVNGNDTASRKTVNACIMTTEAMASEATAIPPYLAVYMWKRTA